MDRARCFKVQLRRLRSPRKGKRVACVRFVDPASRSALTFDGYVFRGRQAPRNRKR